MAQTFKLLLHNSEAQKSQRRGAREVDPSAFAQDKLLSYPQEAESCRMGGAKRYPSVGWSEAIERKEAYEAF
jgi:hypothetical protein